MKATLPKGGKITVQTTWTTKTKKVKKKKS